MLGELADDRPAGELVDRFSGGVFFVDLAPLANPALVVSQIAQSLVQLEET